MSVKIRAQAAAVGPAATTISIIAAPAACSGTRYMRTFPTSGVLPGPGPGWCSSATLPQRRALARDRRPARPPPAAGTRATPTACVLRDAEHQAMTRAIAELRLGAMADHRELLDTGLGPARARCWVWR